MAPRMWLRVHAPGEQPLVEVEALMHLRKLPPDIFHLGAERCHRFIPVSVGSETTGQRATELAPHEEPRRTANGQKRYQPQYEREECDEEFAA